MRYSIHRPLETVTPVQTSTRSTSTPSSSRMLCENCQKNQSLIYQIMSDYIRDENVSAWMDKEYRVPMLIWGHWTGSRVQLLCSYSRRLSTILAWKISIVWWLSGQGGWHCRRTKGNLATTTLQWKVDSQHDNKSTTKAILLRVHFKRFIVGLYPCSFSFHLCSR